MTVRLYRRLMARCATGNQVNAAQIALTNRMTPLQLDELWQALGAGLSSRPTRMKHAVQRLVSRPARFSVHGPESAKWLMRLRSAADASGKMRPEGFVRRRICKGAALYTAGGDRAGKVLLVCFSGRSHRMMTPTPVFLQHLDGARVDVALLRDFRRQGYRRGIEGLAANLAEIADNLPGALDFAAYERVAVLGTSGGGLPAVLTALRLGIGDILAIGANDPDDPKWSAPDGPDARRWIERHAGRDRLPSLVLAYGDGVPKDRTGAESLARLLPATIVEVTDPSGPVPHAALHPLAEQGLLAGFLKQHLRLG